MQDDRSDSGNAPLAEPVADNLDGLPAAFEAARAIYCNQDIRPAPDETFMGRPVMGYGHDGLPVTRETDEELAVSVEQLHAYAKSQGQDPASMGYMVIPEPAFEREGSAPTGTLLRVAMCMSAPPLIPGMGLMGKGVSV